MYQRIPKYRQFLLWLLLVLPVSAERFCATSSHGSLSNSNPDPATGNANMLKPSFRQPWPVFPRLRQKYRVIRYCHIDKATRDALECSSMRPAFAVWAEALGTVPNGASGHSLAWKEPMNIQNEQGDYEPRYCFKEGGQWNPAVPQDTLAIHMVKGATPQATIGYMRNGEPGRHQMVLPERPALHQVVHEIGHVLGMVHEQCRNDRDPYIEYRCQNIRGYGKSLTDAILAGETDVDIKLCDDKLFAEKYNFDGSQFTKNAQYADIPGILDEAGFDMGSIMMYPSNAFSNPECGPEKMDKCPMVGIDRVDGKLKGTSWIHGSVAPSAGDVAFVKKWYPWNG